MAPTNILTVAFVVVASAAESNKLTDARKAAQDLVDNSKLKPARKFLKAELQSLRERADTAAGPGAHWAEGDSQIPYLRLGPDDAEGSANLLSDLGGVYQLLGQQVEGLAVLEEAADIWRALFGERDPRYGLAADRLADAHVQNGNTAAAMQLWRKLLDAMRSGLGRAHPGYQYARALASTGRLDEALRQAEGARDAYADRQPGGLDHAMSYNGVAGILERLGRNDEAVEAMGEALRLVKANPSIDPELARQAQRNYDGLRNVVKRKRERESREL